MNRTPSPRRTHVPADTRITCPYCVWLLAGLALMLVLPGSFAIATPFGPIWLLLLVLPFCSAVLRRMLRS